LGNRCLTRRRSSLRRPRAELVVAVPAHLAPTETAGQYGAPANPSDIEKVESTLGVPLPIDSELSIQRSTDFENRQAIRPSRAG
jgi:hypothetical protein